MRRKSISLGAIIFWAILIGVIVLYRDATKEDREQENILENFRENATEKDGVKYYLDEANKQAIVVGLVNDKYYKIEIAPIFEGYPVTKIQRSAFQGCRYLEEVTIPETVTEIESYAFDGCIKLKGIILPSGLKEITDNSFSCTAITEIEIPSSVEKIGKSAFSSTEIKEVHIPGTVKIVESFAFSNSQSIKKIVVDEGVTTICDYAFSYNLNLSSITFPDSIEEFGEEVLECAAVKKVRIPAKIMEVHDNVFSNIDELEVIELPEGCTILVGEGEKAVPIYAKVVYY